MAQGLPFNALGHRHLPGALPGKHRETWGLETWRRSSCLICRPGGSPGTQDPVSHLRYVFFIQVILIHVHSERKKHMHGDSLLRLWFLF